jgi:hypothetical protein
MNTFSKAYLKDKKVKCGPVDDGWNVYVESRQWGTISITGKTMAEAIVKLLDTIDEMDDGDEDKEPT